MSSSKRDKFKPTKGPKRLSSAAGAGRGDRGDERKVGVKGYAKTPPAPSSGDRVRSHREEMRRKGMRPITLWVPDTRSPEFLEAAREACLRANEADKTDPAVKAFDAIMAASLRDLDKSGL